MCGLQIFALPPKYHLLGNVISATVDLVCINLQPEYELPSSTSFEQFQKFVKKIQVGAPSTPSTPRKQFLHWSEFFIIVTGASDVTIPSSINISDMNGFPGLGPRVRGRPRGREVVPHMGFYVCDISH